MKASDNSLCHLCNSSINLQLFQRKVLVKYKGHHHITTMCEILWCLLTPEAKAERFILAYEVQHNLTPGQPPLAVPLRAGPWSGEALPAGLSPCLRGLLWLCSGTSTSNVAFAYILVPALSTIPALSFPTVCKGFFFFNLFTWVLTDHLGECTFPEGRDFLLSISVSHI